MSCTILLAEDNEDDVFFFKATARKLAWPHELIVAPDGRGAVEHLVQLEAGGGVGTRLSLVVLDLKMPFMSGLDVLRWASARPAFRFLPFVVLTSSEQEADIETAYRLGAASFLIKPSQPEGLAELLRALDHYWLRHNRLPGRLLDHTVAASGGPALSRV
jgi:CheY-like chemotaxis protein